MFGIKRSIAPAPEGERRGDRPARPRGRTRRELLAAGKLPGAAVFGFGFSGFAVFPDVGRTALVERDPVPTDER